MSKAAVASFVLGLLGGWVGGVIFALMALKNVRRRGLRGRGLAMAGLILSVIWAGVLTVVVAQRAEPRMPFGPSALRDRTSALAAGTCVNAPLSEKGATRVGCTGAHDAEVTKAFDLTGDTYDAETVKAAALAGCEDALGDYAPDLTDEQMDQIVVHVQYPSERSWRFSGDRTVICLASRTGEQLTRSLKAGL
jgi:hypothetical protein